MLVSAPGSTKGIASGAPVSAIESHDAGTYADDMVKRTGCCLAHGDTLT
jgi:hypothetical protein